ncbi:MAG: cache domain-containing protein [Candidatus Adiutrix sp.]
MEQKRRLTQIVPLMLSVVSLMPIFLIGTLWINFEETRFKEESAKIRHDFIQSYEASIHLETNRICDYIEAQRHSGEISFFTHLRERTYDIYSIIQSIAENQESGPTDKLQLRQLIVNAFKGLSFDQGRGRYFIYTTDGHELLNPTVRYEQPQDGPRSFSYSYPQSAAFSEILSSLNRINEGFYRYHFVRSPNKSDEENEANPDVAFLKLFAPFNWIIGASESFDEFSQSTKELMLSWASSLTMPTDNYLAIITYDGDVLYHPQAESIGKNLYLNMDISPALRQLGSSMIRGSKGLGRGTMRYLGTDENSGEPLEQIAYYRSIPAWRWVVVTWANFNDLSLALVEREAQLKQNVQSQIWRILSISLSMLLIIILFSKIISTLARRSFTAFFKFFEEADATSTEINPNEQPFAEFAQLAIAANNMIAQRRLATQLQMESEAKFKTIFDVSPQVITISDPSGLLIDASEEFLRFSKQSLSQAVNHPLTDNFPLDPQVRHNLWQDIEKHGTILGQELNGQDSEGRLLVFLVFGKMIHLGPRSYVLAIFTDITALKAVEEEKLELQDKLLRSQKMEAMGLMAAEVAHDLNNILSGIIGYPELLLLQPETTAQQGQILNEILSAGKQAAAVVNDLLAISKRVAQSKTPFPLNEVITNFAQSDDCLRLGENGQSLVLELDPLAGNIVGSPIHLAKAIGCLVTNSFEALGEMENAAVKIKTETIKTTWAIDGYDGPIPPGNYLKLSISDNGPGIPREDLDKIFEPFHSHKRKDGKGAGLGLAIVWNVVSEHEGRIELETTPQGTTFSIYFKTTKIPPKPKQSKDLSAYKGAGELILIVDDVDIQRKLTSKMLTTLGYEPLAVPSGEEAIELLKTTEVALIVLDMIMDPGINGRQTYEAIKAFKPNQKAIIASGMADTEEVAKAQALGATQFINKPYTIADLAVAVHKALRP